MTTVTVDHVVRHAGESARRRCLEYDFYGTTGSSIHDPAGSVHTFDAPAADGITEILFIIEGVLLNLAPDGSVQSISDGPVILAGHEAPAVDEGSDRRTGVIVG
jgi:hypothetical protein